MKKINPKKLFPTVTLESISNDNINFFIDKFCKNETVLPIMVYQYDAHYYIIDGHHRMLASIISKKSEIDVIVLENDELPNWCERNLFESTLNSLGMRTIYDFEAIGDFSYDEYPPFYMNQEN